MIAPDGEVKDGSGKVLGFIEPTGDCGSPAMDYLGCAKNEQVLDRADQPCAAYDQGRAIVADLGGSTICEVSRGGRVMNNAQQTVGYIEGFSYTAMQARTPPSSRRRRRRRRRRRALSYPLPARAAQTVAAYVVLIDPSFMTGY